MAKLFNRAKMTTATTGSGTVTLGSASNGFQTFAAAGVSNGDVVQYVIEEGANFEIGTGTYSSSGTSLTRSPTESSNSNNAITLAGQATVSITAVADDLNRLQHGGSDKVTVSSTGASVTGNLAVSGTVDGRDVASDGSKLDGIESGATADQTAAQIRAKVEAASDSNVFTDADHSKLNGIEAGATGDQTNAEIRAAVEAATDSNVFTDADHTKLNGIEASATADQTITAGGGLTGGGTGDVTLSHSDTSSQASVNGSGRTYIQDITLDTYGHVTGLATATETVVNTDTNTTYSAGSGLSLSGTTFSHSDTSSQGSVNNSGRTYIQDITLDTYGHITGITSGTETVVNTDTNTTYSAGTNLNLSGTTFNVSDNPSFNDVYVADQIIHTGDTDTYMQFHTGNQWRVVVAGSERLEVKNASPHVLVSGDLNSTSDERLKKNIKPIDNALADICQLEGVTFDWRDTGTQGQGFIAQQVEPIIPEVVNTDEDTGMKSINYVGLIGHLVEAIKTQQTQIDDLKAEIQSMKS